LLEHVGVASLIAQRVWVYLAYLRKWLNSFSVAILEFMFPLGYETDSDECEFVWLIEDAL